MSHSYRQRPCYPVVGTSPATGYGTLAGELRPGMTVAVDGAPAVDWATFAHELEHSASLLAMSIELVDIRDSFPSWEQMLQLTRDSTIEGDPNFGKLFGGTIGDLVTPPRIPSPSNDGIVVVFGPGASLTPGVDRIWYADLAKRHGLARLGNGASVLGRVDDQQPDFRRMVFVDWPAVDRHSALLVADLDRYIDLVDPDLPVHIDGDTFRASVRAVGKRPFRTVPHFTSQPWGGQWMKETLGVDPDARNVGLSYELIAPEAGVLIGTDDAAVEICLAMILAITADDVMGPGVVAEFGHSFPIRFDYLDTMAGGDLSVHCHPLSDYMKDVFGWPYTQHESYYLMETSPDSFVYLGLREDADIEAFRRATRQAELNMVPFDIKEFVSTVPAQKHDLLLVPAGTPHGSSAGNVVLEVSATPYHYSLRFYDYLRNDLDGHLRPIHIDHAFANLVADRRGRAVDELVARPSVVRSGTNWQEELLASRSDVFFEVWRARFADAFVDDTDGRFHVLTLVEGESIDIQAGTTTHALNYAETILIPAATGQYRLVNQGGDQAMVVKARVRP